MVPINFLGSEMRAGSVPGAFDRQNCTDRKSGRPEYYSEKNPGRKSSLMWDSPNIIRACCAARAVSCAHQHHQVLSSYLFLSSIPLCLFSISVNITRSLPSSTSSPFPFPPPFPSLKFSITYLYSVPFPSNDATYPLVLFPYYKTVMLFM